MSKAEERRCPWQDTLGWTPESGGGGLRNDEMDRKGEVLQKVRRRA